MSFIKQFCLLAVAGIIIFVATPAATVQARSQENQHIIEVEPLWQNVSFVDTSITFSGTTANLVAQISALTGTTNISGTVRLERRIGNNFQAVRAWSVSSLSRNLLFSEQVTVTSGNTYRLTITANVTRNGVVESVSNSSQSAS